MTNEEAIEILQEEHDWVQEPCYVINAIEKAIEALRSAPAHIDREAWTADWIKNDGYTECSKCEYWYDSPENEDEGDRPAFCPSCGRAMTPKAWAKLEKREKLDAEEGSEHDGK